MAAMWSGTGSMHSRPVMCIRCSSGIDASVSDATISFGSCFFFAAIGGCSCGQWVMGDGSKGHKGNHR